MRIEWTGTRNAASTGTGIGVDALDVVGVLSPDIDRPDKCGQRGRGVEQDPCDR